MVINKNTHLLSLYIDTYKSIPAPTGLQEVGDKLTWDDQYPFDNSYSYLVEWTSSEDTTAVKGHMEVTKTEWTMNLDPGSWQVEVRVIHVDSGSVSTPTAHLTTIEGNVVVVVVVYVSYDRALNMINVNK